MNELIKIAINAFITFIVAYLTYRFTVSKERKSQVNTHKLKILNEIYTPMYRVIFKTLTRKGYAGLNGGQIVEIIRIADDHVDLMDPELEKKIINLKSLYEVAVWEEGLSVDQVHLDSHASFYDYLIHQYNKLRKELDLPYEKRTKKKLLYIRNKIISEEKRNL